MSDATAEHLVELVSALFAAVLEARDDGEDEIIPVTPALEAELRGIASYILVMKLPADSMFYERDHPIREAAHRILNEGRPSITADDFARMTKATQRFSHSFQATADEARKFRESLHKEFSENPFKTKEYSRDDLFKLIGDA